MTRPESRPSLLAGALELAADGALKTDEDVRHLIEWMAGPIVSTHVNCGNEDHTSPFRFVADVMLRRTSNFTVWANRSGSKSYLAGLLTWLRSNILPRLETTVLGGSLEQSEKVYKAMNDFWDTTGLRDRYLDDEPTRRLTRWKNGSRVSVLTASTRSARGPHPQSLIMDEIDEMDEEVYKAALSQPQSKFGIAATIGKFSTSHRFGGLMDQAVDQALRVKTPVYKWCVWDCLKSCRDYSCSTCKLTSFCPGEHMREADGYYEPADFIQKLEDLNEVTLAIEWFCRKIGRSDLVYGEQWDEALHSPLDLPEFNAELPVFASIDWGGGGACFSVGFWQGYDWGWLRFDEYYKSNTTNQRMLVDLKKRSYWLHVKGAVADPSRPDLIKEWEDAGVKVSGADNAVDPGIEAVRNALRPVLGSPKIFVARRCRDWIAEVRSYFQRHGKPVKDKDHAMDETRYFVKWKVLPKKMRTGKVWAPGVTMETAQQHYDHEVNKTLEARAASLDNNGQRIRPSYRRVTPDEDEDEKKRLPPAPPLRKEKTHDETKTIPTADRTSVRRRGRVFTG